MGSRNQLQWLTAECPLIPPPDDSGPSAITAATPSDGVSAFIGFFVPDAQASESTFAITNDLRSYYESQLVFSASRTLNSLRKFDVRRSLRKSTVDDIKNIAVGFAQALEPRLNNPVVAIKITTKLHEVSAGPVRRMSSVISNLISSQAVNELENALDDTGGKQGANLGLDNMVTSSFGRTPLHHGIFSGIPEAVILLNEFGADSSVRVTPGPVDDSLYNGLTGIKYAIEMKN